jgi:hypothetical protein
MNWFLHAINYSVMRLFISILLILFAGCKSRVDIDHVEQREHGLTYMKGTNKLVDGQVVRKFENGRTAEVSNYRNGKPIGNWYAYGYDGEVVSHGFGVDAEKYGRTLAIADMENAVLSINIEGSFSYATLYVDNNRIFEDVKIMMKLSREIFSDYSNQYKIGEIYFFDNEHRYTISKSAIDNSNYKIDTVMGKGKKIISIH